MSKLSFFSMLWASTLQMAICSTTLAAEPISISSPTETRAEIPGTPQLTLDDLKIFESDDPNVPQEKRNEIAERIKQETGLVRPRPMPEKEKKKMLKAFKNGRAAKYSVQELLDAGVFQFKPILNLHPNCPTSDDDKSVRMRDGRDLAIENDYWGKKNLPAVIRFGVMHSTEDGLPLASQIPNAWNKDCSKGNRSSSTPFVVGRCVDTKGPEIVVTADYETRWQRHCSSKLTSRPELVNWTSIGIEMIHSDENGKKIDYTDEEVKNAARLWTYVQQRTPFPDSCFITHGEIQGHLPKEHKSFRSDPVDFPWEKFAKEVNRLRKVSKFEPPASDESAPLTKPQQAISDARGKHKS